MEADVECMGNEVFEKEFTSIVVGNTAEELLEPPIEDNGVVA